MEFLKALKATDCDVIYRHTNDGIVLNYLPTGVTNFRLKDGVVERVYHHVRALANRTDFEWEPLKLETELARQFFDQAWSMIKEDLTKSPYYRPTYNHGIHLLHDQA